MVDLEGLFYPALEYLLLFTTELNLRLLLFDLVSNSWICVYLQTNRSC